VGWWVGGVRCGDENEMGVGRGEGVGNTRFKLKLN